MSTRLRRILLTVILLATLLAAWFAPEENAGEMAVNEHAPNAAAAPAAVVALPLARSRKKAVEVDVLTIRPRGEAGEKAATLFDPAVREVQTVTGNKPVVELPEEPAAPFEEPAPPAPPFLLLGRYEDQGRSLVFLQYMDSNLVVAVGDTIAGSYRVEKLEGSTLTLRYLPRDLLQTLDVGSIQ